MMLPLSQFSIDKAFKNPNCPFFCLSCCLIRGGKISALGFGIFVLTNVNRGMPFRFVICSVRRNLVGELVASVFKLFCHFVSLVGKARIP